VSCRNCSNKGCKAYELLRPDAEDSDALPYDVSSMLPCPGMRYHIDMTYHSRNNLCVQEVYHLPADLLPNMFHLMLFHR